MPIDTIISMPKRTIIRTFLIEEGFLPKLPPKKDEDLNLLFSPIHNLIKNLLETPRFYRNTGIITFILGVAGAIFGIIDKYYGFTELNFTPYVMWCFSCASLYYTNKIALKEWKKKDGQGIAKEGKEGENNNS